MRDPAAVAFGNGFDDGQSEAGVSSLRSIVSGPVAEEASKDRSTSFRVSPDGERLYYVRRSKQTVRDRIHIAHAGSRSSQREGCARLADRGALQSRRITQRRNLEQPCLKRGPSGRSGVR